MSSSLVKPKHATANRTMYTLRRMYTDLTETRRSTERLLEPTMRERSVPQTMLGLLSVFFRYSKDVVCISPCTFLFRILFCPHLVPSFQLSTRKHLYSETKPVCQLWPWKLSVAAMLGSNSRCSLKLFAIKVESPGWQHYKPIVRLKIKMPQSVTNLQHFVLTDVTRCVTL